VTVSLEEYLRTQRRAVDETLDRSLPAPDTPPKVIHEAMRYSVMAGGKRIRPILAIAAAESCGADPAPLLRHFSALELIHTYSLIHDDLPALDNDELRRGSPTSHVVFGEAIAILSGDALLTEAFSWLAQPAPGVPAETQLKALAAVASAVDSRGMIGGQVADLEAERSGSGGGRAADIELLSFIHRNKTGRLLTASVLLGGLLGGATGQQLTWLEQFGQTAGLAFQIVDDLLDEEEPAEVLGKTAGKDAAQGKLTWPGLMGAAEARREVRRLLDSAVATAGMIAGPENVLSQLARYICDRRS
jgi:geranylgeranyl diphosphate synthase, type II